MAADLFTQVDVSSAVHPNGHAPQPRPRVRGLRLPALPSWPLTAQVLGAGGALAGVWHEWGWGVTAIVGGTLAVLVGALREGGKI